MENRCATRVGAVSEIKACVWLLENGWEVFRNVAPSGPADLVAFRNDEIIKIDVKTISLFKGRPAFHRKATRVAGLLKIEVLYVFPDGSCQWARDIDPHVNHDFKHVCKECKKSFIARKVYQKFCTPKCKGVNWRTNDRVLTAP